MYVHICIYIYIYKEREMYTLHIIPVLRSATAPAGAAGTPASPPCGRGGRAPPS